MALTLDLPTLMYKLTINKGWKVWFSALTLVFLILVPSSAPCLVLTLPADSFCPPPLHSPLQPWEEEAHTSVELGLISSAHLEAGWGLTEKRGLDLLAVSSAVAVSKDRTTCSVVYKHREPSNISSASTVLSWSHLICLIVQSDKKAQRSLSAQEEHRFISSLTETDRKRRTPCVDYETVCKTSMEVDTLCARVLWTLTILSALPSSFLFTNLFVWGSCLLWMSICYDSCWG